MNAREIDAVWTLLAQTWGAKFLEQYGANPNDAWTAALSIMDGFQARHAWTSLVNRGSGFPPTLPEFISEAKTYKPPAQPTEVKRLPHASEIPEARRRALREQMYRALYGDRLPEKIRDRLDEDSGDVWVDLGR